MTLLIALAAAAAAPQPGSLKTYNDWIVGCDNVRSCQAVALMPEDGADGTTIVIARGGEAMARPNISINIDEGKAASIVIDEKRLPIRLTNMAGFVEIDRNQTVMLIDAMRAGRTMSVLDAGGKVIGTPSLSGVSAALLYLDEQQKRLGTVTALVRKGTKPATAVPVPPAAPVIVAPKVPQLAPRRLSPADIARTLKPLECTDSETSAEPTYARLDAATSLALLPAPCGNGAYNFYSFALLIDNAGKVRDAVFDAQAGMGGEDPSQIDNMTVNADWDVKKRRLTTYAKGRGLGDCGSMSEFAWDGRRFRLSKLEVMGECRGSTDYIRTWQAAVR